MHQERVVAPDLSTTPLPALLAFDGRVAIVTGGAKGIGLAIGRRFVEAGATVVLADLDEQATRQAAGDLATKGHAVRPALVDARDPAALDRLAGEVSDEHGRLDIWVNNTGRMDFVSSLGMTPEQWEEVTALTLSAVFFGAQAAARRMKAAGRGGVILNMSSGEGFMAGQKIAAYAAHKWGLRGLTASLAVEFGPLGIRVLGLAPTLTMTPGAAEKASDFTKSFLYTQEEYGKGHPLGRAGLADDVARAALFCASDLASFMTGTTVPVDGGLLAMGWGARTEEAA